MEIFLEKDQDTLNLGKIIASLIKEGIVCPLFFQGSIGVGKTSLIKAIVKSLYGGEEAEVSSPSFNLFNIYPTKPEVIHFDLYRCEKGIIPDEVFDYLYYTDSLVMVEWVEYLPKEFWPEEAVLFLMEFWNKGRKVILKWEGNKGEIFYNKIVNSYSS